VGLALQIGSSQAKRHRNQTLRKGSFERNGRKEAMYISAKDQLAKPRLALQTGETHQQKLQ